MIVGLLGLQGAFLDHVPILQRMGIASTIVRDMKDLQRIDRLILPGGESTVMAKFLTQSGMLGPLRQSVLDGMPVWGICAGAILLAETVDNKPGALAVLPLKIIRNAYGRQISSAVFSISIPILAQPSYRAVFIRAPKLVQCHRAITIHASLSDDPVFVQHANIMATTFHPELNPDNIFHEYFLKL